MKHNFERDSLFYEEFLNFHEEFVKQEEILKQKEILKQEDILLKHFLSNEFELSNKKFKSDFSFEDSDLDLEDIQNISSYGFECDSISHKEFVKQKDLILKYLLKK